MQRRSRARWCSTTFPSRTGANLEPATILRLAEDVPNIQGVKESSGNLQQIAELIHLLPPSFAVLAGDDLMALPVIALGGTGLGVGCVQ